MYNRKQLVSWMVFYCVWFMYTFLIVPMMGDWVYFAICMVSCFMMIGVGFNMVDRIEPASVVARSAKHKGHKEAEWRALVAKYNGLCLCCKRPGTHHNPITRDHIVPRIKGGPDTIDNLQPLCKSCNSRKRDKTIDYRP